jgi:hypothetical protein
MLSIRFFSFTVRCLSRFKHSYWNDLKQLAKQLPTIANSSKSENSIKKYSFAFSKFKSWCTNYNLCALPASVTTIAVYISYLVQREVSTSVVYSAYYGIKWEKIFLPRFVYYRHQFKRKDQ